MSRGGNVLQLAKQAYENGLCAVFLLSVWSAMWFLQHIIYNVLQLSCIYPVHRYFQSVLGLVIRVFRGIGSNTYEAESSSDCMVVSSTLRSWVLILFSFTTIIMLVGRLNYLLNGELEYSLELWKTSRFKVADQNYKRNGRKRGVSVLGSTRKDGVIEILWFWKSCILSFSKLRSIVVM